MSRSMACALRFFRAVEEAEDDVTPLLHEEIEVHDFDLPDAGVYFGHEGVARWLADWSAPWEEWSGHVHDLFDLGAQVASLNHLTARTASGIAVNREDSQLCTIDDGRIVKLEYFGDAVSALDRADDAPRARARKALHDRIRFLYEAAVREDVKGVVAQLAADYEFYPEAGAPMGPAYRGHEGARSYFREIFEAWEILSFDVERLVDVGDSVLALFEMRNRGRGSGAELTGRWAEIWQTSGSELTASRFYQSHDEALAAAGLG
jgi:ketosteroid isomerase-like protein